MDRKERAPKIPDQFHIGFQLGLGQIFPTLHPSHILDADGAPVQPDGMAVQGRFRGQLPDGPVPVPQIMGSHVQGAVPEMRIHLREKVPVHPIP